MKVKSTVFFLVLSMIACYAGCGRGERDAALKNHGPVAEYRFPDDSYQFIFAGHTYGSFRIKRSPEAYPGLYPPLLKALQMVNFEKIAFMIFGGDAVYKPEEWPATMEELSFIRKPLYFVKGDHECYGRSEMYRKHQPSSVFYFLCENDLFLILDSQKVLNTISEDQILFIRALLEKRTYRHIIVFFHRLLWVDENHYREEELKHMYKDQENFKTEFWENVVPIFEKLEQPVYFFAGDAGLRPTTAFSHKTHGHLHFVASGVGSARDQNFLIVKVSARNIEIIPVYLLISKALLKENGFLKEDGLEVLPGE